jgi:hypothetical protein
MATAIAAPHLSTNCRSKSQISLFDCERNSILGIHMEVGAKRFTEFGLLPDGSSQQLLGAITREKPVLCCLRSL